MIINLYIKQKFQQATRPRGHTTVPPIRSSLSIAFCNASGDPGTLAAVMSFFDYHYPLTTEGMLLFCLSSGWGWLAFYRHPLGCKVQRINSLNSPEGTIFGRSPRVTTRLTHRYFSNPFFAKISESALNPIQSNTSNEYRVF